MGSMRLHIQVKKKSNLYELVNKAPEAIAKENIVNGNDVSAQYEKSEELLREKVALAARSLVAKNPATVYNAKSGEIESSDVREESDEVGKKPGSDSSEALKEDFPRSKNKSSPEARGRWHSVIYLT